MVKHCPNSRKIIFLDHLEINKIRGERKVKRQIGSCFISNNCTPLITQLGDMAIAPQASHFGQRSHCLFLPTVE